MHQPDMIHPGIIGQVEAETSIKGEIASILYTHLDSYVLRLAQGNIVTISYGNVLGCKLIRGEVIECEGAWEHHPLYGDQFIANSVTRSKMEGSHLIVTWIASNPYIKGVGASTAKKLIKVFKDNLSTVLDNGDINQIMSDLEESDVKGVKLDKIITLMAAWQAYKKELKCIDYLNEKRLPFKVASFAMNAWEDQCEATIEYNPYVLSAFMRFEALDRLVKERWDIPDSDERRIVAACEDILYEDYSTNGHTGMPKEMLDTKLNELYGFGVDSIPLHQDAVIVTDSGFVQGAGQLIMESFVEQKLSRIQHSEIERVMNEPAFRDFQHTLTFELHPKQIDAVKSSVINPVSIISGGAGTGKTTVLSAIISVVGEQKRDVILLAPTGKAARRMSQATKIKAQTVCKFIGDVKKLRKDPEFDLNTAFNRYVFVIDEIGMLDLPQCYGLLSSLPIDINLILVGDPRQLPPVGPGLFFHQLIKKDWVAKVKLEKSQRQSEKSDILQVTDSILAYKTPDIEPTGKLKTEGCAFFDDTNVETSIQKAAKLYTHTHKRLGKDIDYSIQCIAGKRNTVKELNQIIQSDVNEVKPGKAIKQDSGSSFMPGDKVIYNENDYNKNLTNGAVGMVEDVFPEYKEDAVDGEVVRYAMSVRFDDLEDIVYITDEEFQEERISLAYAITAHKSQGSEYHTAIIVLDSAYLMDNAWIYTAITRAKKVAYILGSKALLEKACRTEPKALSRRIGVAYDLQR